MTPVQKEKLLQYINSLDTIQKQTALNNMVKYGEAHKIYFLYDAGVNLSPFYKEIMHCAIQFNRLNILRFCAENGANLTDIQPPKTTSLPQITVDYVYALRAIGKMEYILSINSAPYKFLANLSPMSLKKNKSSLYFNDVAARTVSLPSLIWGLKSVYGLHVIERMDGYINLNDEIIPNMTYESALKITGRMDDFNGYQLRKKIMRNIKNRPVPHRLKRRK